MMSKAKLLVPGLTVVLIVAFAANHLGDHYGAPIMLFALLLGMALHFLYGNGNSCAPGIEFAAKRLLRIGVALLGLQVAVGDVLSLGLETLGIVIGATTLTVVFGILVARLAGRTTHFGILTGGAVGICGASAAIAISSVLTEKNVKQSDVIFTIASVATLSTIAMIIYPVIVAGLGMNERTIGIFLGATIHDVAQVVGAGYAVSDSAGAIATTVKLLRVAMLMPLVVLIALSVQGEKVSLSNACGRIPGFVIAFAALVVLNSLNVVPTAVSSGLASFSRWLLIAAISALGMMTSVKAMADLGARHLLIVIAETLWLFGVVLMAILFLPR